jgi:hypothetical protein
MHCDHSGRVARQAGSPCRIGWKLPETNGLGLRLTVEFEFDEGKGCSDDRVQNTRGEKKNG